MRDLTVQIPAIVLAALGIAVSILDITGTLAAFPWLETRLPTLTLLLVAAVAGYLAFGRPRELRYLKGLTDNAVDQVVRSLSGVQVRKFNGRGDYYTYLGNRISSAKTSVDDLTWGSLKASASPKAVSKAFAKYSQCLLTVCEENEDVMVREVFTFHTPRRLKRARGVLESGCENYFLKYYPIDRSTSPPLMQFIVIDNEEVIFGTHRGNLLPPEGEFYCSITHPVLAEKFSDYFNAVWQGASNLQDGEGKVMVNKLDEIEKRLEEASRDQLSATVG